MVQLIWIFNCLPLFTGIAINPTTASIIILAIHVGTCLTEERDRISMNKPEDGKKIKTTQGTYDQYVPFLLHAELETRECVDYLWNFRNLVRNPKLDLESLKLVSIRMLEFRGVQNENPSPPFRNGRSVRI
jgi:hypothetical protein